MNLAPAVMPWYPLAAASFGNPLALGVSLEHLCSLLRPQEGSLVPHSQWTCPFLVVIRDQLGQICQGDKVLKILIPPKFLVLETIVF